MTPEDRLIELEIALTHQQALLEDLNLVVRDQADRLDRLGAQLLRLAHRLAAAEIAAEIAAPDGASDRERLPPHW